ncbi:MAG: murein peptide amidase [Solirubrobacteraceae bacterium]|nr:murein peptide amidase [Solirubrobacteraceae bacterium]
MLGLCGAALAATAGASGVALGASRASLDGRVTSAPAQFVARSVEGRLLRAVRIGSGHGPAILVVGAIHGNEPAGIAVARDLLADAKLVRSNVWVVSDLNPDGVARGTRQNAHGVDLNRNFPWHWRIAGQRGDLEFSGPRVLSEPESRFAYELIRRVHPRITIWFHQPFGVVDASGGSLRVEQRFARRVGLPVRELTRYQGSAASWQDHRFRSTTSFVVELPSGALSAAGVERYARAVELAAR